MTALPGWPAVSGAATFQHIRRALAGQVVQSTAGVLRAGILPFATTALVTGTATMNVSVGPFVAVLDRNGAVFLPNDGPVNVLLSSAPASGSRWSVIYVKQRESDAPFSDGVDGPIIDKVEATSSVAVARSLLPAGALELAVVQVNAGAANTNAAEVTYSQTVPYTAMEGGTVLLRNQAEAEAWTPHNGSLAFRLDTGHLFVRRGGNWVASNTLGFVADGSRLTGASWDGQSPLITKVFSGSPQVSASSISTLTFPGGAFPNGVLAVRVIVTSVSSGAKQTVVSTISLSQVGIQFLNGSGGGLATGTAVGCVVEVLGW